MWAETLVRGLDLKSDAKGLAAMVLERKNKSTRESTSEPNSKGGGQDCRPTRLSESDQADVRGLKSDIHLTNSFSASEQTASA